MSDQTNDWVVGWLTDGNDLCLCESMSIENHKHVLGSRKGEPHGRAKESDLRP